MTLVGKILTVMILIMSIVFMAFTVMTYATHRNWRDLVQSTGTPLGLKHQLDNAKDQLQQRQAEIEELNNRLAFERAARREALSVLEVKVLDLTEKLEEEQSKFTNLTSEHRKNIEVVNTAQTEMQRLKNEVSSLRGDLKQAMDDRNAKLAMVTELSDRLHQNEGNLERLKGLSEELRGRLSRTKLVLDRNGLDEFASIDNIPPDLDGVVTFVRNGNLIEVSLGSDEGLRAGHKLDIYRQDGSYIGRVVVIDTDSDRAVARVVP